MLPWKLPLWSSPVWLPLGHWNILSKTNTILLHFLLPLEFPGAALALRVTLSPCLCVLPFPAHVRFPSSRPLYTHCLSSSETQVGSLLQAAELSSRPGWGESLLLLWHSHGPPDGSLLLGTCWLACLLSLLLWGPNWLLSSQHSASDTWEPRKRLLTEWLEGWRWLPRACHRARKESRRSHPGFQRGLRDHASYLPTAPGGRLLCLFFRQSKKKGPGD